MIPLASRFAAIGELKKEASALTSRARAMERELLADHDLKRRVYHVAHMICTLAFEKTGCGCYEDGAQGFLALRDRRPESDGYRATISVLESRLTVSLKGRDYGCGWFEVVEPLRIPLALLEGEGQLDRQYRHHCAARAEVQRQERLGAARQRFEQAQRELAGLEAEVAR